MNVKKGSLNLTALDVVAATILIFAGVLIANNIAYLRELLSKITALEQYRFISGNKTAIILFLVIAALTALIIYNLKRSQKDLGIEE